jgi:hypothetical protein
MVSAQKTGDVPFCRIKRLSMTALTFWWFDGRRAVMMATLTHGLAKQERQILVVREPMVHIH